MSTRATSLLPLHSFRRLRRQQFAKRFYELLLRANPEIARMFRRTDIERQSSLLEHGVLMLLEYASGSTIGRMAIERLAEMHDRNHLGVKPEHYRIWVDCLVRTASELDPEWTPDLEVAWRAQLEHGIRLMVNAYDPGAKASGE